MVEQAVLWFTDTVPAFEPAPGAADLLVVTAPGYRRSSIYATENPCAR